MRQPMLVVATSALVLACGVTVASAQQSPGGSSLPQLTQPQMPAQGATRAAAETTGQGGMMGRGGFGPGGVGPGGFGPGAFGPRGAMGPGAFWYAHAAGPRGRAASVIMRVIFALMDTDGDGTVSLQEWQAAHERIFKAMNTSHDGKLTFDEMRAFIRGRPFAAQPPQPQQPSEQQPK